MSAKPIVAISGASGYVGSVIANALSSTCEVVPLVRKCRQPADEHWSFDMSVGQMEAILRRRQVTHIIHAAWDMESGSLRQLEDSCVAGSRRLLEASARAEIHKFIFISTISAFDGARSAYGRSKLSVEKSVQKSGGLVLRLGLVYSEDGRGMYGKIRQSIGKSLFVPVIGNGSAPQYLIHERVLSVVVSEAVRGSYDVEERPLLIANPTPVAFSRLLRAIAAEQGAGHIFIVPIPWRLLYGVLRGSELLGLKLAFKSDSVLSFVFQNKHPDFNPMRENGIVSL